MEVCDQHIVIREEKDVVATSDVFEGWDMLHVWQMPRGGNGGTQHCGISEEHRAAATWCG